MDRLTVLKVALADLKSAMVSVVIVIVVVVVVVILVVVAVVVATESDLHIDDS